MLLTADLNSTLQRLQQTLEKLNATLDSVQTGNPTAQIIVAVVPILGILVGGTLLFFFFLWQYRLKKELIRNNQYEPTLHKSLRGFWLLVGSVATAVGLPMTLLFYLIEGVSYAMLGGLVPVAAGLGLLLYVWLTRE